ncbi:MAG: cytochrome c oxidase subunit 3 [Ferruginibacter sp.]
MEQRTKIHPHKFNLWIGIGSMLMMFAGLTSAFIIKRNQAGWISFDLPPVFWYSTAVILLSSISIWMAQQAFKARLMNRYRVLMALTLVLGVLFLVLQYVGFKQLWAKGITLTASVSYSFLYVIVGMHALHLLGGIAALVFMLLRAFGSKVKTYSTVPVELISTYWHFVDLLWIYLLFFLLMIK